MSLLFTLMLQCFLLRRRRTRGPYHPICCPCLCVSQLISLTKSRIVFQLSFILSCSLPCPSLSLSLSLIYQGTHSCSLPLPPYMFEKGAWAPKYHWRHLCSTRSCPWDKHTKYIIYPSYVLNIDYFTDVLWKWELGHAWSTLTTNPL